LASNRSYKWGGHNGGFCFVTLGSAEEAEAALKGLDGTEIGGRVVHVEHQQKGKPAARKTMLDKVSRPGHVFREPLSARDEEYVRTKPLITGTVSRTGTMLMTVAVTTNRRYLDADTKTHHVKEETVLVHDPEGILAEGDVVKYQHLPPDVYGKRAALGKTNVKHILKEIVTPFGIPVEERTPSLTNKPNPDKSRKRKRKPAAAVAG
jgi:RNA recognition motif-containing protein